MVGMLTPMGMLVPISRDTGWHTHQGDTLHVQLALPMALWGTMLQPKAFSGCWKGLHPCKVPQLLQDGCSQQAGEDVAREALISLQGQGCARGWCSHRITVLGPGTMWGGARKTVVQVRESC